MFDVAVGADEGLDFMIGSSWRQVAGGEHGGKPTATSVDRRVADPSAVEGKARSAAVELPDSGTGSQMPPRGGMPGCPRRAGESGRNRAT